MKKIFSWMTVLTFTCALSLFTACSSEFVNPGDYLGGGKSASSTPADARGTGADEIADAVGNVSQGLAEIPDGAVQITAANQRITAAGNYYVFGELRGGTISVEAEGVTLYLKNATLSNGKKVIESSAPFTLTLIGKNTVENTDDSAAKTAITCDGGLIINGSGSLDVISMNNGIKADSIIVKNARVYVESAKDGLRAEISAYDNIAEAPSFSYDSGYVYLQNAYVGVMSQSDGIQADTFVYVEDSTVAVLTNGGAPTTVTESSSDNGEGKGIKAGALDWGANDEELTDEKYLIYIDGGEITVNSNDDAIHSNGELVVVDGRFDIQAGADAIHADSLLEIKGGTFDISKCYEGVESAKVEISGGYIHVTSTGDGINAADGTTNPVNQANPNCHLIISGGKVVVKAGGDGVDSNGSLLVSGGELYVSSSAGGANAALDADGSIIVNGGTLVAVGALGMVQTPASNSKQNCVSFAQNKPLPAGTILTLTYKSTNEIIACQVPKNCQSAIISSPELLLGDTYHIYGGSTRLCSFTVESTITKVGSSNSIANPSGSPNRL